MKGIGHGRRGMPAQQAGLRHQHQLLHPVARLGLELCGGLAQRLLPAPCTGCCAAGHAPPCCCRSCSKQGGAFRVTRQGAQHIQDMMLPEPSQIELTGASRSRRAMTLHST